MKQTGISILVLILMVFPFYGGAIIIVHIDKGILFDPLSDYSNIEIYENCTIEDGAVTIIYGSDVHTDVHTYTLLNENCTAYERKDMLPIFFISQFFGPNIRTEREFNSSQINAMVHLNDGKITTSTASGNYLVPLQHFHFHTTAASGSVSRIVISWNGSFNSGSVKVFAWDYSARSGKGMWKRIGSFITTGENNIILSASSSNYVSNTGDVDIILVPALNYLKPPTKVTTDYISIEIKAVQYRPSAFFITKPIEPAHIWRWESVLWNGTTPNGTRIRCQILYENESIIDSIEGNNRGFTDSPLSLSMLSGSSYKKIRLKFCLETQDQRFAPVLSDYTLLWQLEDKKWKDSLTASRIEERTNNRIVSIPINLPQGYWWNKFYADYNGSITFKILDENKKVLMNNIEPGDNLSALCTRTIRLYAELDNNASIENWSVTFEESKDAPEFRHFTSEFVNNPKVSFTINATDDEPGLLPSSAKYKLEYRKNGTSVIFVSSWLPAKCSGDNCTKEVQITTPEISLFYEPSIEDILDLHGEKNLSLYSVRFYIEDMAGNAGESERYRIFMDVMPPSSHLIETEDIAFKHRYESVVIKAWADDDKTGIASVALYFAYSSDNKTFDESQLYDVDTAPPWEWAFTPEKSGYYRLFPVATDNAENRENLKSNGLTLLFDINNPSKPIFDSKILWLTSNSIDSVRFEDDFKLSSIEYKLKDERIWHKIADNLNSSFYNGTWRLSDIDWENMEDGIQYLVYFNVTDIAGNRYVTQDDSDALIIAKDTRFPVAQIDRVETWQWKIPFEITTYATDVGSGIKSISLYYQHSPDNRTWSEWRLYNTTGKEGEQVWKFSAPDGDGYYRFYIEVVDQAGNIKTSDYIIAGVTTFPTTHVIILLSLLIILIIATFALVKKT